QFRLYPCSHLSHHAVYIRVSPLAFLSRCRADYRHIHSFPTRRSSDLREITWAISFCLPRKNTRSCSPSSWILACTLCSSGPSPRSEEHTSELQSRENLVCRLLLEKKK